MLHAINQNKAGRGTHEAIDWRVLFKGSEDTLTSAVFGSLFHLPAALFWELLDDAFFHLTLPITPDTRLLSYEFWPRWDATGTTNTYTVEPDVFIRANDFDLIVEAKRDDVWQQYEAQWANEVGGYFNEYKAAEGPEAAKPVFLLAVGGFGAGDEKPGSAGGIPVFKCRWRNLLGAARHLRQQPAGAAWPVCNILDDVITGFSLHGFTVTDWFATLPQQQLQELRLGRGRELLQTATGAY